MERKNDGKADQRKDKDAKKKALKLKSHVKGGAEQCQKRVG
jgi:hypothetical protein